MENHNELIKSEMNQLLTSNSLNNSLQSIQAMGAMKGKAVPTLRETIRNNEDSDLKTMAIIVLGEIGESASVAIPEVLNELILATNDQIRMASSLYLVKIGNKSIHSLKEVISNNTDDEARFWCCWALAMIDPNEMDEGSTSILLKVEKKTQDIIKKSAAQEALAKLIGNTIKNNDFK
ncbi:HEAT repeat domain-containing protein [Cytobacillus sp. IB215665]|uniref:HEAT repeat domain-containing protein n=1 Tax=Cytobacillus sp. IB215665 TaxID=3097357 RepID=UPI002A155DC8|nr:HEAT repeat domain-containing protein [Cytobacillus sp. IB215665]MDX8363931.1 HEAT repeat domain-containing protein [Cytobacillus sp. IB215665]